MYYGDRAPGSLIYFNFNTAAFADGSPVTLAGTPSLAVYKNSATQSIAGLALTVDYDAVTGMHHVVVDTSADGTFYAAGNDFSVVVAAGTVGGTSVVGRVVGAFSLNNAAALRPAVTGRTLAVDAAGGVTLADAVAHGGTPGSSTATLALKQLNVTNSAGDAVVAASTGANGKGVNASGNGAGGGVVATGGATGAGLSLIGGGTSGAGLTVTTTSGDGLSITPTAGSAIVATANGASKHGLVVTGGTGGTSDGLKAVAGSGGVPVRGDITGNLTGTVTSLTAPGNIWDVTLASHVSAGSTGFALNAAGSAGDPWATTLPGGYTAGTAGFILGQQLGAAFTTTSSSVFTVAALANAPTGGSAPTAAQIATAVWQDTTAGDFTVAGSIGKSLFTAGAVPGAAGGLVIAGANAATTFATLTSTGAFTINGTATVAQTGDSFARIGAAGSGLTSLAPAATALSTATWTGPLAAALTTLASHDPGAPLASQTNITGGTITTTTNLTNAPTTGDFTAVMKASIGTAVAASAVASVTGNVGGSVGSVVAPVTVGTNNDKTAYSLTQAAYNDAADTTLRRHAATVEAGAVGESVSLNSLYGLVQMAQKADTTTTPGSITVFKTTGAQLGTLADTTDPAADPITAVG